MKHRKHEESLCDTWGPEDEITPAELAQRDRRQEKRPQQQRGNHRALQYCKQARIALETAMSCDLGDPLLHELTVIAVRPITGCTVIEATLVSMITSPEPMDTMHQRLTAAEGVLRSAVAGETHRKRVARIRFRIVPGRD
ncbi:MAG: hypothetical protein ACKVHP_13320 [Verrucomicrobiales bacterium]